MRLPHALASVMICLVPFAAVAQDDLLAPLETNKPKPKPKPKNKPVPHVRKTNKPPEEDIVAPLVKKKTQIAIKVTPSSKDATIFVDGNALGPVPDHPLELPSGEHTVTVKRPGFADFTQKFTLGDGQTMELPAALEASSGVLAISSEPEGAEVAIDGRAVGSAPMREYLLSPGSHEVLVHSEGYDDDVSHIVVKAGKQYTVTAHLKTAAPRTHTIVAASDRPEATHLTPSDEAVTPSTGLTASMEEEQPVYKRWYFWAGAAVVVAAAVVTAVAVTKSNGSGGGEPTGTVVCGGHACSQCIGAQPGLAGCP